jgi:hypothetical protein
MRDHIPDPDLLSDIKTFIKRYVALPSEHHADVLAVYVIHTWNIKVANVTPYLYVYSKGPQSGKTRLVEVLTVLCRNARRADDMTAPVMFKIIDREMPTLMTDEVDTIWSGARNEPKRNIYNTGYKRGGCAWREQARELIQFSTFCAKVLAGINNGFMPPTIRDRCIPIEMERRTKDQPIERFMERKASHDAEPLLERISDFSETFRADILAMSPEPMDMLSDRQDEISEPLLQIAAVLGVEQQIRHAIERVFISAGKHQPSPEQVIFGRIHQAFDGEQKIFTDDLCSALGPMYNGRTLALWLEPFGISPKNVRVGNQVMRGYTSDQFAHMWGIHLNLIDDGETDDSENEEEVA